MSLEYVRRGAGEPLLLIQGWGGTVHTWGEPFLGALEKSFDVVIYNHRGVGKSPRVHEDFTTADLADDAAALLAELGWTSAHVLGISMGGMVAQELVLRHPDRVRSLILGCTYCGGPNGRLTSRATIERLMSALMTGDRELATRASFEANLSPAFRADEARFAPFHEMVLARPIHGSVLMRQMQACVLHDTSARLPSIAKRTLLVHGTADEMLVFANSEAIAGLIPGARLVRMEDVGHLFWWEKPEESAKLISGFVLDS